VVEGDEVVGVFGPSEPQREIHAQILPQPKRMVIHTNKGAIRRPAYQDAAFARTWAMRFRQSAP
jgi:hypothetical protein